MSDVLSELRTLIYSRATFETFNKAQKLINHLMSSGLFTPTHFGEYTPLDVIREGDEPKIIELIAEEDVQAKQGSKGIYSTTFLNRQAEPKCSYRVEWSTLPHTVFTRSSYTIDERFVKQLNHLNQWLEFCFTLVNLHKAWYAPFMLAAEQREKNYLSWRTKLPKKTVSTQSGVGLRLEEGIPGIFWGNYFGRFYVDWFGKEKFETLPCFEKRWFDDGGIFFTICASPFDWHTPEARQNEMGIKEHLGTNAFFELETVKIFMAETEAVPQTVAPEYLQPPRWVPEYPFTVQELPHQKNKKRATVIKKSHY